MSIDPTARIAPGARVGSDVEIGPYCVVGPDVEIGDRCRLLGHVHISGHTRIGPGTSIAPFASLGGIPQSVHYRGEPTRLEVGAECDIREYVTMSIGTAGDRGVTTVGDRCMLMAGTHVAHDCVIGEGVIFANNATLGGHVTVGQYAFVSGNTGVHQFVRIGEGAMIGGLCAVRADVIPFGICVGVWGRLGGLNVVGMKRRKMSREQIHALRRLYNALFHGTARFAERVAAAAQEFGDDPVAMQVIDFIRTGGKRPLTMAHERGRSPTDPVEM